ncbi:hypothetical protein H5410_001084 [Solanum commersonii]|uniref:PROP1-like PPR domain-containing protein n=1 Tax=Solanum commersonii TaxID=4109 RepID=A0A9J6AZ52_SOLCO|nr:hypothetical protein H5410_001084 [Solanum commersonii]
MLLRLVWRSYVVVRPLSTEAATTVKSTRSGGGSGITSSLENGTSTAISTHGRDTIGRRLLSLIYAKRSVVIAISKWKEEGHHVRKYKLNHIVRELRKHKRYKYALEFSKKQSDMPLLVALKSAMLMGLCLQVCEWMRIQDDIQLLSGDYAVHLDLIAKVHGMNSAEKFFEDLPDRLKVQTTCAALLHTYVQHKDTAKAESLMEKMSDVELKKNASPDIVTYNLELAVFASQNNVEAAEKVLLELKKAKLDPDWITKARTAYASLISLHANLQNKDEVFRMWKEMKSIFRKVNDTKYSCIISSLLKLDEFGEAMTLFTEWEVVSVTKDTRIANLILVAYINKNEMEKAVDFHNRMMQKGISLSYTTWELLMRGYLKQKEMDRVSKWDPDAKMVREMSHAVENEGDIQVAEQLLVTLRHAKYVNTEIYNALLRTYVNAGKMPMIVAERMKKVNVEMDEETQKLIGITSKMTVTEVPNGVS